VSIAGPATHHGRRQSLAAQFFDRTGAVRRPPYALLARELWSLSNYRPPVPDPAALANGRGHVVLIVPAYLTGESHRLARFLGRCGFRTVGLGDGINWGPTRRALAALRNRLSEACALEGGPVSVVGVSLGGVMARDLAYDRPNDIRCVVTLAAPFRLPTACTITPLFRLSLPFFSADIDIPRLKSPLPVPSTAIYTREDGIVAWESTRSETEGRAIEVPGPHITMARTPEALHALATSLAATAP
jgi:pimeloyl-ACP methyl ester carboxylesterase